MGYSSVRDFITSRAKWLIGLSAFASLSAPVSRLVPTDRFAAAQWALEMAAHWQWTYLLLGATGLVLLLAMRRSWWLIIPVAILCSSFFVQSPTLERGNLSARAESVLKVGTANLNFDTTDFRPLIRWLVSADAPDVVFLQEFTGHAQRALKTPEILTRYPYRLEAPQSDQFGLAILSRHPLSDAKKIEPQNMWETLRLRALLTWRGKAVHLSAVHPMPPLNATYAQIRDQTLILEARHLTQAGGLALMAGDFNNTPWTNGMFDIGAQMRRANGIAGSWPNAFGLLSMLPLDHILASRGWQLMDSNRGPNLGSDHRPVIVKLMASS